MSNSNDSNGGNPAIPSTPGEIEVRVNDKTQSTTVHAGDLVPKRTGILATARDPRTTMPAAELTPTTRIHIGNVGTTIDRAVKEGYLRVNDAGEYEEVPAVEREAAEQKARDEADEKAEANAFDVPMTTETDEFLTGLHSALSEVGGAPDGFVAEFLVGGIERVQTDIVKMAQKKGVSVDFIVGGIRNAVAEMKVQADSVLKAHSLDPDEVWEWADKTIPTSRLNAIYMGHLKMNDKRPYEELARKFIAARGGSRVVPKGIEVKKTSNGAEYVQIPGYPPMSTATARRMRLI
jgi:hypothetical protein